jgi:hypothetical protein
MKENKFFTGCYDNMKYSEHSESAPTTTNPQPESIRTLEQANAIDNLQIPRGDSKNEKY